MILVRSNLNLSASSTDPSEWPRGVVNVDGGVLFRFETAVGGEYRIATR